MSCKKRPKLIDWDECPKQYMAFKFAYIGFNYDGVASQKTTQNTVEEQIFNALIRTQLIQDRHSCNYSLCGRTDKGVSSLGNVFSILLRSKSSSLNGSYNYQSMLNKQLPNDIRIIAAKPIPHHFDARFSCLYREYKYFFLIKDMSIEKMRIAAEAFIGVHDFRNFCKDDSEKSRNPERRILSCGIEVKGQVGEICVRGYSFLWHQVRCMVSVLFKVGEGIQEPGIVKEMLEYRGAKPQYEIASEVGLVLFDCVFETLQFEVNECDQDCARALFKVYEDLAIRMEVVKCISQVFKCDQDNEKRPRKKIIFKK